MLSHYREKIRELEPLKSMLITTSEQCDQKILRIREEVSGAPVESDLLVRSTPVGSGLLTDAHCVGKWGFPLTLASLFSHRFVSLCPTVHSTIGRKTNH